MNLSSRKCLFPGQQDDERIYLVTRPHWLILVRKMIVWFLFVIFLIGFDTAALKIFPNLYQSSYFSALNLFKSIYLMLLVASFFSIWVIYYLNYQIVTNERIVDIDQKNIFHRVTSELHLSNIEDVSAEIKGVLGTFFNYGNIYVQTAASQARFEFNDVPEPHVVAKLILDLYERVPHKQKVIAQDVGEKKDSN